MLCVHEVLARDKELGWALWVDALWVDALWVDALWVDALWVPAIPQHDDRAAGAGEE
jgi:hypothetical protein